jgi:2-isopropylmalate synthase
VPQVYALDYLHVSTGTGAVPTATVRLKKDGKTFMRCFRWAMGRWMPRCKVIDRITGMDGKLEDFSLQAVTKGEDAVGEVSVRVNYGDEVVQAKGSSTDIIEASAKAYLNALNRYLFIRSHRKPAGGKAKGKV